MSMRILFPYALEYYAIKPDGTLWIKEGTPKDIQERLKKDFEAYKAEMIEKHNKGIYDSGDVIF
jgi:hypothetical protein